MKIDYNKIGNFEEYKEEPGIAVPIGLVKSPNLILKMYDIRKTKNQKPIKIAKQFLKREIENGGIIPLTGMGFAILSEFNLNVGRWDAIYPIVIKNQLYKHTLNFNKSVKIKRLNLDEKGSFCIWELGIVNYEKELWKGYLNSQKTKKDKRKYLESMLEGEL